MFSALASRSLSVFPRRIELLLSWNKMFSKTLYPWAFKKYRVQQISGMKSSAPTISVSVKLRVLSFCFVELTMGNPRPKDNPPPECPRMLGWTANNVSTHHFKIPIPLALRISGSVRVPLMYLIMWTILAQLSSSGAQTIVVGNATAVQVSGLASLVAYTVFSARLLNCKVLFCSSFSQSLSNLNRFSGAALIFVTPPLGFRLVESYKDFI